MVHIPDYFEKVNNEIVSSVQFQPLDCDIKDRILFCDDHLIVVNKPSNMLCQVCISSHSYLARERLDSLYCVRATVILFLSASVSTASSRSRSCAYVVRF